MQSAIVRFRYTAVTQARHLVLGRRCRGRWNLRRTCCGSGFHERLCVRSVRFQGRSAVQPPVEALSGVVSVEPDETQQPIGLNAGEEVGNLAGLACGDRCARFGNEDRVGR